MVISSLNDKIKPISGHYRSAQGDIERAYISIESGRIATHAQQKKLNSGQVSKSKFVKKIEVMMKIYFDTFDVEKLVIKTIENFVSDFKSGKVMDKYLPVLVA